MQRGHNREPCFFAEDDYLSYLHWLGEALTETECQLDAYVLMTNHVHLLLTPKKAAAIPRLLISLGRRYVQYVNRAYKRSGTLWARRPSGVSTLTLTPLPSPDNKRRERGDSRCPRARARADLKDGRYKSSVIHADTYLLTGMRYIELSPVRAAMVEAPAHYRWTSYRANGPGQADARLSIFNINDCILVLMQSPFNVLETRAR